MFNLHALSVFQLAQGSAAILIMSGWWDLHHHMCCTFFVNITVKTELKSVHFWRSNKQKYLGSSLRLTV